MTAITVNPDQTLPLHEDGTSYYAAFVEKSGLTHVADTLTEIVGAIITDYPNRANEDGSPAVDLDEALIARVDVLAEAAGLTQALLVASVQEETGRRFTEYELTAMFAEKDSEAIDIESPWDDEVIPLILLSTTYAPYSPHPRPAGSNILWLDPTTELTFLRSLASVMGAELFTQS